MFIKRGHTGPGHDSKEHLMSALATATKSTKSTKVAPTFKATDDVRKAVNASVASATALGKAQGKFSMLSARALMAIVSEYGADGKDTTAAWNDAVARYGDDILKPASGRAYLSHMRKAFKVGKSIADISAFLNLDADNPKDVKGLASLGAWLREDRLNLDDDKDADDKDADDKGSKDARTKDAAELIAEATALMVRAAAMIGATRRPVDPATTKAMAVAANDVLSACKANVKR